MADTKTYSPSDIFLSFGGYSLENWESISLKREVSLSRPIRGIRGKNTRVMNRNPAATITIVCAQTSDVHSILYQILAGDSRTRGNGRLEISILDRNAGAAFQSNEAYIIGHPERKFSDSVELYTWSIYCQTSDPSTIASTNNHSSLFDKAVDLFK